MSEEVPKEEVAVAAEESAPKAEESAPKAEEGAPAPAPTEEFQFSTGTFDCCGEPGGAALCAMTFCCPCFVMGKNNEYAGGYFGYIGGCITPFVPMVGQVLTFLNIYKQNDSIVKQNNKKLNFLKCCCCNCCCTCCSIMQLRREQIKQGGDPGYFPVSESEGLGLKAPKRTADNAV